MTSLLHAPAQALPTGVSGSPSAPTLASPKMLGVNNFELAGHLAHMCPIGPRMQPLTTSSSGCENFVAVLWVW